MAAPAGGPGRTPAVPEIPPLDQCDFGRAKIRASVRWLLSTTHGGAENVPVELQDPFYTDQYEQEHLKPAVSSLLLAADVYCCAAGRLSRAPTPPSDAAALLQLLVKKGLGPKVQDQDVTEGDLNHAPIKTRAHLALMDALMSLGAQETVGRVKMAAEAEQMGAGAPWENALLFWVNRLNQRLRESTEEGETPRTQTCTDLQPAQETCQSSRWYWKLVPHAIAFCLKESGNKPPVIRYRKDKVQSKLTPTFPLVSAVKDLSNGCAIAAVLHYYCPSLLRLEDVCLKDTMSVADSLYNLQLIKEFCQTRLQGCCPLPVEDLLYAPAVLHLNIMSFIAELLDWFEIKKPDFVQPIQPVDLTDISGLLYCTSPVSGNSNSGSPSFIFKQPFVPISSPVSPESQSWTKKQISRPLSAVTFSIPFGLDSDVDVVMGNPIDSVFRSVSTDSLSTAVPAMTSPLTSAKLTQVPYSPPEDLSHLVSASAPPRRSSWGPYAHTPPLGELPTIEEALQAVHTSGGKERRKGRVGEKGGGRGGRPEPRLCPEGAPAGFFLHSSVEENPQLSSSAPTRSGFLYRPVADNGKQGRGERGDRSSRASDMSRDDDSVLRDGSVDSSDTSDDAPGNIRPSNSRQANQNVAGSPRMTSFAERRDSRRRHPGEESGSAATPTTPGTPHTPSTPAGAQSQQGSPGPRGPEPGTEAWELGVRLEEKRRSIEAQKRRIEAIFTKHRQRLGKNALLQMKREQGEGGAEGGEEEALSLDDRLTRMEEQLKQEEERENKEKERDKERDKVTVCNPPRLDKQVTFSIDTKKGEDKEKGAEKEKGSDVALVEYNQVVQKLSEALQSLQKDMQKLTEQQQQLLGNQRPRSVHKAKATTRSNARVPPRTPPHTPTKTPPRTPTKNPTVSASKAWNIPTGAGSSSAASPSRRSQGLSPKTIMSSSCPAPRTKIPSSSASSSAAPRSPKHHPRPPPHPRPSELKFPPLNRILTPTQNVDTLPHLRRVSPSKCQVQTSSSFRIGGPQTPQEPPQRLPQEPPQVAPQMQADESASDTGSSETPTQFSLELEDGEATGGPQGPVQPIYDQPSAVGGGGSSSGAPSECSFESETLSLSAVYGPGKRCSMIEVSLSSLGGPEGGSDEPTDEGQEFSSDSMSDRTESATEAVNAESAEQPDPLGEAADLPEPATEQENQNAGPEPPEENSELATRGGIGFFFTEDVRSEGEMAQRRALLLERQQRRTEELRKRRQWHEQEREKRQASPPRTPPAATTSPSPTPPATPARRGDFTRGEYARRQQLRIMDDLEKVLRQKPANHGRPSGKKARSRPRSATRDGPPPLSQSPARKAPVSKLTKVYSHSSLNLAAEEEPSSDVPKRVHSRPESPAGCRLANQNGDKDWEGGSNGPSPSLEYTGPRLFKEPSLKSNKFIIHNALSRCCLAGKVNENQKTRIVEEMEKSPANHFLILFRDSSCQFRGVYTMSADAQELVRLAGVGPRTVGASQVDAIYKYSSDRKQFSAIPSKTMGMSVDAFTIPGHLWQGGGASGGGGGARRASINKKAVVSK